MYKTYFRTKILMSLLMAFVLVLSACGGGNDEEPASAESEAPAVEEPAQAQDAPVAGDPAAGEKVYQTTCIACHGPDARGIQALGKSLHPSDSEFISERTDEQLVEYIKVGRRIDDPLNTTGIDMPPKGGNPAMTEEEMYNVVAYIRTLE
ncbi:MAG: cytochrome c [Caldilineaceae bacterium]|nr:cytochrome c [Caldilineaceae bacterium]